MNMLAAGVADTNALHRDCKARAQAYVNGVLALIPMPFTVMGRSVLYGTALAALGPDQVTSLVSPVCVAISDVYTKTYVEAY